MTRLAVLSDIHGNLPALEAVIADMAQFHVDHVIVAGDSINCGPFSAAVVARVHASGWAVIRGNNEFYLLDYDTNRMPDRWREYTMMPWLCRQLSGRWQNVIAAWPDALSLRYPDAPPVRICHASPRSPWESIFPDTPLHLLREILAPVAEPVVIAGHTHLAGDFQVDRWRLLNPGSVGGAIEGRPGEATYLLLESVSGDWQATFRRVSYDLTPVLDEFERQQFVAECGPAAHLMIEEFKTARLHLYPFGIWRRAQHPGEPESWDLLAQFTLADRWAYTPAPYHVNLPADEAVAAPLMFA
jgi:predicted phosphodiesterase